MLGDYPRVKPARRRLPALPPVATKRPSGLKCLEAASFSRAGSRYHYFHRAWDAILVVGGSVTLGVAAAPRLRMLQTDKYAVTFAVVVNMSGIVLTASRMPIPATGRFAAVSTGAMMMIPPRGIAGAVRLVATAVSVIVASCHGSSMTPYIFARN